MTMSRKVQVALVFTVIAGTAGSGWAQTAATSAIILSTYVVEKGKPLTTPVK